MGYQELLLQLLVLRFLLAVSNLGVNSMERKFYWILAKDPDTGKVVLISGGATEEAARSKGIETLAGIDFEIKGLPTRNLSAASSMIRGNRLESTHDLSKARERLGHEKTAARINRRRRSKIDY